MQRMTLKELRHLTQPQIKEYVRMVNPDLVPPNKWANKEGALTWVAKNLNIKVEKKADIAKKEKKEKKKSSEAQSRREKMVKSLRTRSYGIEELSAKFGNSHKRIADDLHAIRHGRSGTKFLDTGEILLAEQNGKSRSFSVITGP